MATRNISIVSHNDRVLFDCSWNLQNRGSFSSRSEHQSPWQTIDIVFKSRSNTKATSCDTTQSLSDTRLILEGENGKIKKMAPATFASPAAFNFLLKCLQTATSSPDGSARIAKFIVPLVKGQIIRADIIPLRLIDCEVVDSAVSFAEPLQSYLGSAVIEDQFLSLDQILNASTAELLLRDIKLDGDTHVTNDLGALTEPLRRLRLVIVEGNSTHPNDGGTSTNIYPAAKALGLDIVVLANSGHWLENGEYNHWREAFIPTKLVYAADPEFADRIVASVKSYNKPIDGIITFFDIHKADVAHAASELGLPTTGSADSYKIATNKYETSIFSEHDAFKASSAEEAMHVARENKVKYPLIIKPCNGWISEGVFRVDNIAELEKAARSIDQDRHGSEFVVEKYCSGPEVDANFVLLDGELLFFESSDDFPKSADSNDIPSTSSSTASPSSPSSTFHELSSVFPSALPKTELDLLRNNFLDILTRLGFKSGIMHLEGRIEHSAMKYHAEKNGIVDLIAANTMSSSSTLGAEEQPPAPWLIEINPRPPGMKGTQIIESTYGIDYWGLDMLLALGLGKTRIRALSSPFQNGPQYTSVMVFISADYPVEREGIFASDDICAELLARRPDLAKNVSRFGCLVRRGQKIPHPSSGINSFLAYFNVFSRKGRREALELAEIVREEVRFDFR